jgi:hypothetical protein
MRRMFLWMFILSGYPGLVGLGWGAEIEAAPTPTQIVRYVRCNFQVKNTTDRVVPIAELWVAGPLEESAGQKLLRVDTSHPCEVQRDRLGNRLLRFVFTNMPPFGVKIVNLDCHLLSGPTKPSSSPAALFSEPEPLQPFKDIEFQARMPSFPPLKGKELARAIFTWVQGYLTAQPYDPNDRGALYALLSGKGDCTEFATLFAALCRAHGIPARVMGGYRVATNAVLDPRLYHNWAEFWADDHWVVADPMTGVFDSQVDQYLSFRVLGESDTPLGTYPRFRVVGDGVKAEMLP